MLIAKDSQWLDIYPLPKTNAICPHCKNEVFSKCGDINIWHWAHQVKCPFETEGETKWHKEWKELSIQNGLDIEFGFEKHIADAVDHNHRTCYEFQHSPITREELISRSIHYKNNNYETKWIFDFRNKFDDDQLIIKNINDKYVTFKQKWSKRIITDLFEGKSRLFGVIYFDIGDVVIIVRKLYETGNGWGYSISQNDVFYNNNNCKLNNIETNRILSKF